MRWLDENPVDLYKYFETIGNNCEFGIVQRKAGFDPLGLFRNVGFLNVEQIIGAIVANLDGMFDDGNYSYDSRPGWSDYSLVCHRFGFVFHSAVPISIERGTAEWHQQIRRNLGSFRFLKEKFRDDLVSGEKILIYRSKQTASMALVRELHAAIRSRGPCWLLYIMEAPDRPFGWVDLIDDDLLVGGIAQLSNENPPRIDFPAWEAIARTALAIRFGAGGIPPSWRSPGADTRGTNEPPPPRAGLDVLSHRLIGEAAVQKPVFHYLVDGAEPGDTYLALAWIYISRDFKGRDVGLAILGCESLRFCKVDLTRREQWQQIWVMARFPEGHRKFVPCLLVDADAGSLMYTAGWDFGRFESASLPSPSKA